jgi:hypothetical protein
MKRLRFWFVGVCVWFFLFYNLERLGEPLNLATFVYIFAFISAVLLILIAPLHRISYPWLLIGALPLYLLLKSQLGYSLSLSELPIIVTEFCAIGITIFLASQLGRRVNNIKETLARLTINHRGEEAVPFATGQALIYSEIRRARKFQRPATLLAISPAKASIEFSIDYFIKEAQREIVKQYIAARVSELLVKELQDCDIVAQRNNHFITLLPETTQETVTEIVDRLKTKAAENFNLSLNIGWATFPNEAVTFESLLALAEEQMTTNTKTRIKQQLPGISPEVEKVLLNQTEESSIQQKTPLQQTL